MNGRSSPEQGFSGAAHPDRGTSAAARQVGSGIPVFLLALVLLAVKVLWGYWDRDLTFGDTSSYFRGAVRWHTDGTVNIVWSPLYTVYYGFWLNVSENAALATFLHRLGLIALSTALVSWLALRTLPRIPALLLAAWWLALPIHYDTLYEVHLFGALPLLLLAVVALTAGEKWRTQLSLGVSLLGTVLVRNELVLAFGVFLVLAVWQLVRQDPRRPAVDRRAVLARHAVVLVCVSALIVWSYAASHVKDDDFKAASASKHRLNMCQVYAFGYQQRHPDWKLSPWTECGDLMQEEFGNPLPSLTEMISANPVAVAKHFWWNLSLAPAGLEVLLFNATVSRINPDYAPVVNMPVVPRLLLCLTLAVLVAGLWTVYRRRSPESALHREHLTRMAPVFAAAAVITAAVILTQRPRPSYLLAFGVFVMWAVAVSATALARGRASGRSSAAFVMVAIVLLATIPSYRRLDLPSKRGALKNVYNVLRPCRQRLCGSDGLLALNDYASEITYYLCPSVPEDRDSRLVSIDSLAPAALAETETFVADVEAAGVGALIVDPYLFFKHPGLRGCSQLRDALLRRGWEQLAYSLADGGACIAAYARDPNAPGGSP